MRNAKILVNNKEGIRYITIAESLRKELDEYRKRYGFPHLAREYHIAKDVRIEILSSDINPYIHIYTKQEVGGFICHPRTGEFKLQQFSTTVSSEFGPIETTEDHYIINGGGWNEEIEPINNIYHIPMIDGDGGSSILTLKDDNVFKETHGEFSYGNIYWTNGDKILSWKGPPGKHIPLPDFTQIPGLTTLDEILTGLSGDTKYYTSFGPNIYSEGKILATAPEYNWSGISPYPKVLGAALQDNILVLIAGVNKRNTDTKGFYDSIFITSNFKDWELIEEFPSSRHRLPYFFDSNGVNAVNRNKIITINAQNKSATLNTLDINTDINTTISADFWNLRGQSSSIIFREYNGTELVSLNTNANFLEKTITDEEINKTTLDLPIYIEGTLNCPTISGTDTPNVGSQYTLLGGTYCPANVRWSFSGGTINETTGKILSITGCGTATITATLENCSISKEVRLPTGTWVFSHCEELQPNGCNILFPCVYITYTEYIGAYKYTYKILCNTGTGINGSYPCPSNAPYTYVDILNILTSMGYSSVGAIGDPGCTVNCPCYTGIDPYQRLIYKWECP